MFNVASYYCVGHRFALIGIKVKSILLTGIPPPKKKKPPGSPDILCCICTIIHQSVHKFFLCHFQAQFNMFVISLREQYGTKVKTFRQVIEVHRLELQQKDQYWDEALIVCKAFSTKVFNFIKKLILPGTMGDYFCMSLYRISSVKTN